MSKNGVSIYKFFDGSYYLADEDLKKILDKSVSDKNSQHLAKIKFSIAKLKRTEGLTELFDPKLSGTIDEIKSLIAQFVAQASTLIATIVDADKKMLANELVQAITGETDAIQTPNAADIFIKEIQRYIPSFIFFSDFLDILPFELPLTEAKNNGAVRDFAKVAGLDLDKVVQANGNSQLRRNILSRHSAKITGDFMGYWGQNQLELVAEADGDKLRLGIKEAGKTMLFKPEQRSKGFQWFLSFYLRLNAEKDTTNVILIDEPGLYLHAKAQKDVLKVFEEISKESQVIFSTHSPYLIDAQRLDRLRLVIRDEKEGTRVENKIHKNADNETLTPIMTAIGLDLANDFSIAGKNNVLLEGISDYYFLQALKEFMPLDTVAEVRLIPCVGAPKIPQIASLLLGWDLEFLAVLDNDVEGRKIAKELSEKLTVSPDKVIQISTQDGAAIEDLFTHEDFNSYVLDEIKNANKSVSNSKFLKDQRSDKVLLSKKFFEKVKSDKSKIALSKNTVNNFTEIFDRIVRSFKKK
jgi:predicted ATP-dependent endonuclease of OLD family